jgi:hypothetical protein
MCWVQDNVPNAGFKDTATHFVHTASQASQELLFSLIDRMHSSTAMRRAGASAAVVSTAYWSVKCVIIA